MLLSDVCFHCNMFKQNSLDEFTGLLRDSGIDYEVIDITPPGVGSRSVEEANRERQRAQDVLAQAGLSPNDVGIPAFVLSDPRGLYYSTSGNQSADNLFQWLRRSLGGPGSSYYLSPLMSKTYSRQY